jgi:hypothetical protein
MAWGATRKRELPEQMFHLFSTMISGALSGDRLQSPDRSGRSSLSATYRTADSTTKKKSLIAEHIDETDHPHSRRSTRSLNDYLWAMVPLRVHLSVFAALAGYANRSSKTVILHHTLRIAAVYLLPTVRPHTVIARLIHAEIEPFRPWGKRPPATLVTGSGQRLDLQSTGRAQAGRQA